MAEAPGNYQILSLDGGGIRGYLTVRLLEEFTKVPGLERVFDSAQLIAGNSSGALIALGMARARAVNAPMSRALRELAQLFLDGKDVFGPTRWYLFGGYYFFSRYWNRSRRRVLEEQLANTKLRELGTHVVITTFDLDNEGATEEVASTIRRWKPKVFHNFKRADGTEPLNAKGFGDREELARTLALYSSSAPAYFAPPDGYIDGGVYANNPAMCALAQVFDKRYEPLTKPALSDVTMFSVGAGRNATFVEQKWWKPWGGIPWLLWHHYIDIPTEATVGIADYQCRQLLGEENYRRCDVDFPQGLAFALDATERVSEIEERVAKATNDDGFHAHVDWLKRYWVPRPPMVVVAPEATSRHLQGATELTCLFRIKDGFVDIFETHTYATRLRILLRTLHILRQRSREVTSVRMFADVVDAIGSIHSFRLSMIDNQLMLAVNFDRPWEPYMRIVWSGFGALLDLILVNCKEYEGHTTRDGFDRFAAFIRRHQIESELFYAASTSTVDDAAYLAQLEELVRNKGNQRGFDAAAARLRVRMPEDIAHAAARLDRDEVVKQGLRALAAFYKLRELYREGTPDEAYLRAAVVATLKTFKPHELPITEAQRAEYRRELAWFASIDVPELPTDTRKPEFHDVQAGVIEPCKPVTHGCLLFARIEDAALARTCLANLLDGDVISRHGGPPQGGLFVTLAFTPQGLKRLGLPAVEFAALPKEFREGMEARAGMLGDIAANHPDSWTPPDWNWDGPGARPDQHSRVADVRLSSIDLVIQLRTDVGRPADDRDADWAAHPLRGAAHHFVQLYCEAGIRVLSVQPMLQYTAAGHDGRDIAVEHFGFRDGISQPRLDDKMARDKVRPGELILGYENDRGDLPYYDRDDKRALGPGRRIGGPLDNGTFLVIRKLEQHVATVCRKVTEFVRGPENARRLTEEQVYAKLMGRDRFGAPVKGGLAKSNDFDYAHDTGEGCPLHAHIRLGNPREPVRQQSPIPRIARRAMSYGPRYHDDGNTRERGMMFLAYNASIAEQYEVIQRWMTAGNSTGETSSRTDPFLRVAQKGRDDTFLIPHGGDVLRMDLGDEPFVSLKWGMYLFVPSLSTIGYLATLGKPDELLQRMQVSRGQTIIEGLRTEEEWRVALEDSTELSSGRTAAVCAAIRELHGGAMRTPGNLVLVGNQHLAMKVLGCDKTFSVEEYHNRMLRSFGDIYLGHDSTDSEYTRMSRLPNEAIGRIKDVDAFAVAYGYTEAVLAELKANAQLPIRLSLEMVVDEVLAKLAALWFGIPEGDVIRVGGKPEDGGNDESLYCPHHFLAPSRYIFSSPRPRDIVSGAGQKAGRALRAEISKLTAAKATTGEWPADLPDISQAVWEVSRNKNGEIDPDRFASAIIGAMEGMLPTIYGNFWKTMHLWITDETLWRVQQNLVLTERSAEAQHLEFELWRVQQNLVMELSTEAKRLEFERARTTVLPALLRTMQARPIPDMVYRTAKKQTQLGDITVEQGNRVVVLIGSVTQELAQQGRTEDVYPVFGGNRAEPGHPTHACPAYDMALGVMLGMITAVLDAGSFTPTPTPLVVNLTVDWAAREARSARRGPVGV